MIFIHSISHLLIRRQTTISCMCTFNTCECVVNFTRDITDLCTLYINIIWKHSSAPLLLLYVYYTLRLLFGFFFILLVFCLHPQRISVCVYIYNKYYYTVQWRASIRNDSIIIYNVHTCGSDWVRKQAYIYSTILIYDL